MTSPPELSEDLIAEVLSYLPVKYLLQFRCVSKSWKTLISEPRFVKLHLDKSQSRNPKLFTIITKHECYIPGNDDECEEEYSVFRYPIDPIFENRSFTLVDDPNYHHLNNKGSRKGSIIVGSYNGLILLSDKSQQEYWLRVWNPATRTASEKFGYFRCHENLRFAFGCDHSTGTYKVVALSDGLTRVLNLGGDHVWRNIETFPVVPFRLYLGDKYAYLSGTLNWLAIHNNNFLVEITIEQFIIISLDLRTETYNQYMLPRGFDEVPPNMPTIDVLGGCLCFSYSYMETDFVIWQMKKFGVEDSWTQLLKISYHGLLLNYNFSNDETGIYFQLVPLFLSEDGNTLILERDLESETILYSRRDNRAKQTEIIVSRRTTANNRTSYNEYWDVVKDYVESLVPIFLKLDKLWTALVGLRVIGRHNVGHYMEVFIAAEFWRDKFAWFGIWILSDRPAIQFLSLQASYFSFVVAECLVCLSVQFRLASFGGVNPVCLSVSVIGSTGRIGNSFHASLSFVF